MKLKDSVVIVTGMAVYMGFGAIGGLLLYSKVFEKVTGHPLIVVTK